MQHQFLEMGLLPNFQEVFYMQNNITQEIYKRKIMETILNQQCNSHVFHHRFVDKYITQKSVRQKNLTVYANQILVIPFHTLQSHTETGLIDNLPILHHVRYFLQFRNILSRRFTMKLQEQHNEFAVKCYAKYMKTSQVV